MARPRSEDKKLALLDAATAAIARAGISASTAQIARGAGVAEGTLFRYFATKDELLNALYLHLKRDLLENMLAGLDGSAPPKEQLRYTWNSYIDWGITRPEANSTIRQLSVSEKITEETQRQVTALFPELDKLCDLRVRPTFRSGPYRAFGDSLFLALAETTMTFAARDPARAPEYKETGFETMWRALASVD
ncbi:TetR/AcrR family transcriptional regulator [Enterobacteriaceae bacterium 4M9]|nr:TetR/AcrR family transcriptional regulator [Enterobacteriaceae bacterium 4M9]